MLLLPAGCAEALDPLDLPLSQEELDAPQPLEEHWAWEIVEVTRGQAPPATPLEELQALLAAWPRSDALPEGWDLGELAAAALRAGERLDDRDGRRPQALAWRIVRDERPLLILQALISVPVRTAEDGTATILASLYRHPDHEDRWFVSTVADAVHCGRHRVEGEATRADVLRLVNDSRWLLSYGGSPAFPATEWETLGRGVLTAAWAASRR